MPLNTGISLSFMLRIGSSQTGCFDTLFMNLNFYYLCRGIMRRKYIWRTKQGEVKNSEISQQQNRKKGRMVKLVNPIQGVKIRMEQNRVVKLVNPIRGNGTQSALDCPQDPCTLNQLYDRTIIVDV